MKNVLIFIVIAVLCVAINRFLSMYDRANMTDSMVLNAESILELNKQIEILDDKIHRCHKESENIKPTVL